MNILIHLQGAVAIMVVLYSTWCWVNDYDDIVTRYVQRAGTAFYMWLFFCACLVGLV